MTAILRHLPFREEEDEVTFGLERIPVKADQIIVWVSLSARKVVELPPHAPRFPAILDTGNNFTFSIFQSQLIRWAGIRPELLRLLGTIKKRGKRYPRRAADVWLQPNVPGSQDRRTDRQPFRLTLSKGIAIYPDEGPSTPHLPLLGLRALTDNTLQLAIDGAHREVSLHTTTWITRLLRTLRLPPY